MRSSHNAWLNFRGEGHSDNFGRQFAWSTDGQSIYAVDSSVAQGGIYRIDPTRHANDPTGVTRILDDGESNSDTGESSLRSEPAVVHTSVHDFSSQNPAVGDQIVVEGSFNSGNAGGVNVFVDEGGDRLAAPTTLFTEADFRSFADYYAGSKPRYVAIAEDPAGNLYMYEQQTDQLFRYDTEGRFAKIASEREHNLFQQANGGNSTLSANNDDISNLSFRTSNAPGFEVTEIIYVDSTVNAPLGILAYEPGDFDRDNDVDSADLALFAAALGTRNSPADDADVIFDLNGNEVAFNDVDDDGLPIIRHTTNSEIVVDWRDVKILQQFADFPDGDVNFDGGLDFDDIDVMAGNYYTLGGVADKRWTTGDVASLDPEYAFDVADANLVNEVDLAALADAWVNVLGQPPVTEADADEQGYEGQFREDLLAAFGLSDFLAGDYNGDGRVDAADYTVWRDSLGRVGADLPADGNGDDVIDVDDFLVWRNNFGATLPDADLLGDYNADGVVDAADYTVWRDQLGLEGTGLAADGNNDQVVDATDYVLWRNNFGVSAPSASAAPVPETYSLTLALTLGLALRRRRK